MAAHLGEEAGLQQPNNRNKREDQSTVLKKHNPFELGKRATTQGKLSTRMAGSLLVGNNNPTSSGQSIGSSRVHSFYQANCAMTVTRNELIKGQKKHSGKAKRDSFPSFLQPWSQMATYSIKNSQVIFQPQDSTPLRPQETHGMSE